MADINKTILFELDLKTGKITDETGRVVKSFGDLAKQYDKAAVAGKRYNAAQEKINELQENQARSAGLAGAATFELGRTISDMPFGLVAVSNNISQLGTLMSALVVNAGSVRNALKLIGQQLLGPGGILIGFQLVTAAVTYFAQKQDEAEKETEEFSSSLILQGKILAGLRQMYLDTEGPIERQLELLKTLALEDKGLQKILSEGNASQEQRVDIATEYIQALEELRIKEEELLDMRDKAKKANTDLDISEEKLIANRKQIELLGSQPDPRGAIANRIFALQNENRIISEQLDLLSKIGAGLNYVANERERINQLAAQRTNLIFLTEEEQKALETAVPQTVKYFQEQIRQLEKQRDSFATTTKEIERYNKQIDELQGKLRLLQEGPLDIVSAIATPDTKGIATQNILETLEAAIPTTEEMSAYLKSKTAGDATKAFLDSMFEKMASAELVAKRADMVRNIASSLNDILSAESDRQIAIEKNKTTKLNDQLKARLSNEQLSADERDKINQQISRNEAALVERQNKIAKKQFQREKALKIIMALADTASSASKAYLSQFLPIPTPNSPARGTAAAALATAFGLAQVAALSRMKYTEQGMPTPNLTSQGGGGLSGGVQAPSFNVVGSSAQNQLAAAVAGSQSKPVKAYVVSSDVSTAQEMDRKIVEGASI